MEQRLLTKKEAVDFFIKKGILLSSDFLDSIDDFEEVYKKLVEKIKTDDLLFLNKDLADIIKTGLSVDIKWPELEKARSLFEKGKDKKIYEKFINYLSSGENLKTKEDFSENLVKIISNYKSESKKRDIQDFVKYFNARYKAIEKILRGRHELRNLTSINRIISKKERDTVSLIGIVKDKEFTKNENIMLTLEDSTGFIKVLINKNNTQQIA